MDRQLKEVGSLTYISTAPFNTYFWTYTVTTGPSPQFKKSGALSNVSGATSVNCPAGHVLRENGKKLFPGANPGVNTYMVGIFDIRNGLSGFINPNDRVFTTYNTQRPTYLPDSVDSIDNTTLNLGPSVNTLGPVIGFGGAIPTNLTTTGQIRSTTITHLGNAASGNVTIDVSLGQVFTLGPLFDSPGILLNLTTAPNFAGSIIYLIISGAPTTGPSPPANMNRTVGENGSINTFFANNVGMSVPPGEKATMMFLCDGTNLYEISRSVLAA